MNMRRLILTRCPNGVEKLNYFKITNVHQKPCNGSIKIKVDSQMS